MTAPTRAELLVAAALYVGLHMRGLDAFMRTLAMHADEIRRWPNDPPCTEAIARARVLLGSEWQLIETAPKDGTRILLGLRDRVVIGRWDADQYSTRPRPYWSYSQRSNSDRETPPTHWQPLPLPPVQEK